VSLRSRRRARSEAATRDWVRSLVRSGLGTTDEVRAQVADAIAHDHPWLDAGQCARTWTTQAEHQWRSDAAGWARPTDHDRLQDAFAELEHRRFAVLQGCADHWSAHAELDRRGALVRGVVWFVPTDVWHAIDAGMLELNVWHPDGANAAEGEPLLAEVIEVLGDAGLRAHFDEGRVEVSAFWHRLPPRPAGD
jgi:hypothetical protein